MANTKRRAAPASPVSVFAPKDFVVEYHDGAAVELAEIKESKDRLAVATVARFLRALGPRCVEPHSKSVETASKLRELRPKGGKLLIRPLYAQVAERRFVIFAIGPEAQENEPGFQAAVKRAKDRALADYGLKI